MIKKTVLHLNAGCINKRKILVYYSVVLVWLMFLLGIIGVKMITLAIKIQCSFLSLMKPKSILLILF